ncbi:MAG: DNA polymerase III subunit gamma/tau [Candidatus Oxydemutatoraceae bacterium WSBS_2016_MAG_OTU14]
MSYQVLARKWRPKTFEEVAGQQHIIRALQNTLKLKRLHHAYLFSGTRGVGKTTLARILAKCFNCEKGATSKPCGKCSTCTQIDERRFVDLIEIDAASHTGVDEMRDIIESIQYMPSSGRFKVYLIDEVHMLSLSSFNALLKTLEEPPEHVKFFFATTHPQKLPVTILSRCLQFNLTRLTVDELQTYLAQQLKTEKILFEEPALRQISICAEGSVRDALSLLDHAIVHGGGELRLSEVEAMLGIVSQHEPVELLQCILSNDTDRLFKKIEQLYIGATDFMSVLASMLTLLHEIALTQAVPNTQLEVQFKQEDIEHFAQNIPPEDLQLFYQIALQGKKDLPFLPSSKNAFEMTMLRMLSFKPISNSELSSTGGSSNVPSSKADASNSRKGHSKPPAKEPKPSQTKPVEQDEEPVATKAKLEPKEPVSSNGKNHALQSITSVEDWQQWINKLPIEGALREFCYRSLFSCTAPDQVVLSLAEKDESLFHAQLEKYAIELNKILTDFCGQTINVEFKFAKLEQATPGQIEDDAQQQELKKTQEQFKKNPLIQGLQDEMGAIIVTEEHKQLLKR